MIQNTLSQAIQRSSQVFSVLRWALLFALLPQVSLAQVARLGENLHIEGALEGVASSGTFAPLWFSSNRYGLGSTEPNNGMLRLGIARNTESDSLRYWRMGYGAKFAATLHHDSHFILQELYGEAQYKALRLSLGQKERPMELKNQLLSSGGLTQSINARPLPQVRLELPDYWRIPGTHDWLALKAHIAYGAFTDNGWQRTNRGTRGQYTRNVLYHSKAGFLRIGNTARFPLTLTGGLEMATQFGGEAWNVQRRDDDYSDFQNEHVKMGSGVSQFLDATFMMGSDANDGDFKNAAGNQLGSWHLRLDYEGRTWSASLYAEHFFEDHSQLFWQYAWKDMLYGVEVKLPKNPIVSELLFEHLRTTDQSGSIYHDGTATIPDQISAIDNYYNHSSYTGWHHAGRALGSPLLLSPTYTLGRRIFFNHNRITAHHIGLRGAPISWLTYRTLLTHTRSLGTYYRPLPNPQRGTFLLVELDVSPRSWRGVSLSASYGLNARELLGTSHGAMISFRYAGRIAKASQKSKVKGQRLKSKEQSFQSKE